MNSNDLTNRRQSKFKSPVNNEPRRVQVKDLYCLTRFESEFRVEDCLLKTSYRTLVSTLVLYTSSRRLCKRQ